MTQARHNLESIILKILFKGKITFRAYQGERGTCVLRNSLVNKLIN